MTDHVIAAPPVPVVPVEGGGTFPVRRILCVGRNYWAHRREMGAGEDDRDPPFFFAKPADAVVPPGDDPAYPPATANLHHEIELVVALGAGGRNVAVAEALGLIYGYAVGVDLTRRDLQNAAKDKGYPWDSSKGFDQSAPISAIRPWSGAPPQGRIALSVNGDVRRGRRHDRDRGGDRRRGVEALDPGARRPDLHRDARRRRSAEARRQG
jgi:fumarylpyruvate hydrolase